MPKLPVLTPLELKKKYQRLGFIQDHTTGSPLIMYHSKTRKRAVIPFHRKDLKKGTLRAILRESNITVEELIQA